ncbi:hypothetical protein ACFTAO_44010 [Paenibacillus rhizoplanae]
MPLSLIALMPFALVILQNDLGNALSYIVILLGLLWIGNLKFSHALIGMIIAGGMILGFVLSYIHYHEQMVHFIEKKVWARNISSNGLILGWYLSWPAALRAIRPKKCPDGNWFRRAGWRRLFAGQLGTKQPCAVSVFGIDFFVQIGEEFGFLGAAALLMLFLS